MPKSYAPLLRRYGFIATLAVVIVMAGLLGRLVERDDVSTYVEG